jgi:hypothetical protein
MARVSMEDYRTKDGINWKAYRAAEVKAGQKCYRCESLIVHPILTEWSGGKRLCGSCRSMDNDNGPVFHDDFFRCPKCGFKMNKDEYDLWECGIYEEGEHEIGCAGCNHNFTVTTHISYSFESPAME